jgi:hypothetical protein
MRDVGVFVAVNAFDFAARRGKAANDLLAEAPR